MAKTHFLLEAAITIATKYHAGQKRKWGDPRLDYITHPMAAALIASKYTLTAGATEAMVCHDLIEDTKCTLREIETAAGFFAKVYVIELTNVKISGLSRADQKAADRERL